VIGWIMSSDAPILRLEGFSLDYGTRRILSDLQLTVDAGEVVAVVGPSGAGKSALLRALLGLSPADARVHGTLQFAGRDYASAEDQEFRRLRGRRIGYVPQDAQASLPAHRRVGGLLKEVLLTHRAERSRDDRDQLAETLLQSVGLDASYLSRYPHALSGGQGQRVLVALALAGDPKLLLADEPTSALDPLAAASLLTLLAQPARAGGRGVLLISHDLVATARLADRIAVLAGGRLIEVGATAQVLKHPAHPTVQALIAAHPPLTGERPARWPVAPRAAPADREAKACAFAHACPKVTARCRREVPPLRPVEGRSVACHHLEPSA
jgi:oligopeptide/dipeptide ABC transporter ATP-binding protein